MYDKTYISIDLKAFYASVECYERGFNPFDTNLIVADVSRTEKTICLAVSPSLKSYGISSRARLFEVNVAIDSINAKRKSKLKEEKFRGKSYIESILRENPYLKLNYFVAVPRMKLYMEYSSRIYNIYLKYVSKRDIYVYSIDEVFMDVTEYLEMYKISPKYLAKLIISDIVKCTGISATAGIGSNLYLSKIAMDIGAKHVKPDEDGVRIAELNEITYRKFLWKHQPLTDFWRIGRGYAQSLKDVGIYTMGDIAKCSLGKDEDFHNSGLLFEMFGVNAQLLIDHAWGIEPVTIDDIKSYQPNNKSISLGQVLFRPYKFIEVKLILKEMCERLALDLFAKRIYSKQIAIGINYDIENIGRQYEGKTKIDVYGRVVPKKLRATINLKNYINSISEITNSVIEWFNHNVDRKLSIRKINLTANCLKSENQIDIDKQINILNGLSDEGENEERRLQNAIIKIHERFGKNSLLRGFNLEKSATTIQRNNSIGGHKA